MCQDIAYKIPLPTIEAFYIFNSRYIYIYIYIYIYFILKARITTLHIYIWIVLRFVWWVYSLFNIRHWQVLEISKLSLDRICYYELIRLKIYVELYCKIKYKPHEHILNKTFSFMFVFKCRKMLYIIFLDIFKGMF